jgi:hypothetical protein
VLLVVLLGVAAARPLVGLGGVRDHEPTDVLLLVDNTASMGRVTDGRTLLDHQLEAARATLANAGAVDRFWIAPMVGPVIAADVPAAEAVDALSSIMASDAGGDTVERLRQLTAAVPVNDDRVREAQIFTDLQATGLRGQSLDLSSWGTVLIGSPPDGDEPNGTVSGLRLEPNGPVVPGDPAAVAARIAQGAGSEDYPDTVDVRLIVDGRTAGISRAPWGSEAILPLPDLAPGLHTIRVETPPSGLRSDDSRQLGLVAADRPIVRVTGEANGFVTKALETLLAEGRLEAEGPGRDATVEIVEGTARTGGSGRPALVLVPPADLTALPAFQQRLTALSVPWRLYMIEQAGSIGFQETAAVDGLASVTVSVADSLQRQATPATAVDSVLLSTSDGAPWLVRGRAGDRVFLLMASPMDPSATTLPASVSMIPFMEKVLLHWARPGDEPAWSIPAGVPFSLPARAESVVSPQGDTLRVEGGAPWTPHHAGLWELRVSEGLPVTLGVNVPLAESDVTAAAGPEIAAAFLETRVEVVDDREDWPESAFTARRGAEATPWLLGVVLTLILAEIFLAAPERRRWDLQGSAHE